MKRATARSILLAVVLSTFAISADAAQAVAPELTIQEIVKKTAPSVVNIEVYDRAGDHVRGGTGFFVGPNLVLTNAHIVDEAYSLSIVCLAPRKRADHQPRILKLDPESDLALLETKGIDRHPLSVDMAVSVEPGQRVVAYGNLYEDKHLISEGIVRACLPGEIVSSAPTHAGHSGSPLLDMQGRVIGICTSSSYRAGIPGMGMAVDAATIAAFMRSRDNPVEFPVAGASLFWARIWKGISGFFAWLFTPIFELGKNLFSLYLKVGTVLILGLLGWRIVRLVPRPVKAYLAYVVSWLSLVAAIIFGLIALAGLFSREYEITLLLFMIPAILGGSICYVARRYYRRHWR